MTNFSELLSRLSEFHLSALPGLELAEDQPGGSGAAPGPALPRTGGVAWTLHTRARSAPDELAWAFAGDHAMTSATCAELLAASRRAAGALAARGVKRGEVVLLCLESGLPLLAAIIGCNILGAAAALARPPQRGDREWLERAARLLEAANSRSLAVEDWLAEDAAAAVGTRKDGLALSASELAAGSADRAPAPHPAPSAELALVKLDQSAGAIQATPVTHRELVNRARSLARSGGWTTAHTVLSRWSMHEEMGLLGGALAPLSCGIPAVMIDQRPSAAAP
jgi:acyl-CoA synthetase (AMP-forming)/AMP-acid ligase II